MKLYALHKLTKHINNIFKEGQLDEKSNVQKTHFPNSDKPVIFYNLDVIISVGYRVNSKQGIIFRKWATDILKDEVVVTKFANTTESSRNN